MGLIFAPGWPNIARQREMVADRGIVSLLELGTIFGDVEVERDKKDTAQRLRRWTPDGAAAQEDGLTDHHAMGGAKKGSEGEGEGGGRWEVEAGTNCRAKKVMKIAARGGAAAGGRVQIQKRLYQTKHLTKDSRPRVVSARRETILEDGEKGRRKRWKRAAGG